MIRAVWVIGLLCLVLAACTAPPVEPSSSLEVAAGDGLTATYFDNPNFTGTSTRRIEPTIAFDWGIGSPIAVIGPDTFSATFTGYITAPTTGTYTFYATADDGVRLTVNTQKILDDLVVRPPRTVTGTATLTAGQQVPLLLEYFEDFGGAQLRLEWSGPGITRQVIPQANLSTTTTVRRVFYVAPNGNDSNPGTEARPWVTIRKATDVLQPGQTVYVKDGVYNGILIKNSGTKGQPISYRAFPGAKPKIVITENDPLPGIEIKGASFITIEGFDLDYQVPEAVQKVRFPDEPGITIKEDNRTTPSIKPHHITVLNNRVRGFPGGGIGSSLADYIRIEGNTIYETALWSDFGPSAISMYQNVRAEYPDTTANPRAGFRNVIRGNFVFKNENKIPSTGTGNTKITDGNCIIIDDNQHTQGFLPDKTDYGAYENSTLIENNVCAGNGGRGVHIFYSDNVTVRHNTLYQNLQTPDLGGGELQAFEASNVRFTNNIVYAAPSKRATDTFNVTNVVFQNNLYFNTAFIPDKSSSDLIGNPLFVSPGTNVLTANFQLRLGSPAIDRALASQAPRLDIGKQARPKGSGPDIGAWESY
jgi:parallel beta-helix repeat protein